MGNGSGQLGGWNAHAGNVQHYLDQGWWQQRSLVDVVRANRDSAPQPVAYRDGRGEWTWADVDRLSDAWAEQLLATGVERNERVAVLLPDGAPVHIGFLAAEKSGLIAVGIGSRAGYAEVAHLVRRTGARCLLSAGTHDDVPVTALVERMGADGVPLEWHLAVDDGMQLSVVRGGRLAAVADLATEIERRRFGPSELSMLNSTSGTTGMPKCVMHNQNRWWYFHQLAVESGSLTAEDVFFSAVPMPFGFGLWTAHFTPAYLGAPVGLMRRFSPLRMIEAIERHKVTVLACVSTQFIMMLNTPEVAERDLSSLRVMFTGGEAVPYERAAAFEERFGAAVLQFYGSNETGALSRTTLEHTRDQRLGTAGSVIDEMQVIVLDAERQRLTSGLQLGQPACKGPATSLGYWDDAAANSELFTPDGWMLMGDIVEVDDDGLLRVVGRVADFIIRGGKNISAPEVEAEVATHPAVALAAAVPDPDPVLGERVAVYVTLQPGAELDLDQLVAHLRQRGMSRDALPERLVVLDEMPMSSGGKIAKGTLRATASRSA